MYFGERPTEVRVSAEDGRPRLEIPIRRRSECSGMSQATKIVLGTVSISAVLAAALALGILLG